MKHLAGGKFNLKMVTVRDDADAERKEILTGAAALDEYDQHMDSNSSANPRLYCKCLRQPKKWKEVSVGWK
ncbi:hypothetical protein RRG08_034336 [Elysia crispata]|uniref:Uncharacterized protein n=1 Tax=Elysia crispata TaxID=231223 RepID=A0AAE1E8E0_9GAST|nr:hypothetical protein RRG08_034336 [Elysia crispata]